MTWVPIRDRADALVRFGVLAFLVVVLVGMFWVVWLLPGDVLLGGCFWLVGFLGGRWSR